jgi:hypothetical protein
MYMDNFVDLLDNDSDAAASASTLVAAASVAAAEAGVQASVSPNGTGCHWLPHTQGPARSRGAASCSEWPSSCVSVLKKQYALKA